MATMITYHPHYRTHAAIVAGESVIEAAKREAVRMVVAGVWSVARATRELRIAGCFEAEITETFAPGFLVDINA